MPEPGSLLLFDVNGDVGEDVVAGPGPGERDWTVPISEPSGSVMADICCRSTISSTPLLMFCELHQLLHDAKHAED